MPSTRFTELSARSRCENCSRGGLSNRPSTTTHEHEQFYDDTITTKDLPFWTQATPRRRGQRSRVSSRFATTCSNPTRLKISRPSIIFIHGLTGDREKTWTANSAVDPWPKTLLPSKVPNARVLTFGYDAYVTDWRRMVSRNRIGNHSMNLLTTVASYREDSDTVSLARLYCLKYGAQRSRMIDLSYSYVIA